jgi:outer membrane lipoprotein-sorting protein
VLQQLFLKERRFFLRMEKKLIKKLNYTILYLIILFSAVESSPQSKDPNEILDRVKEAFKVIEDYEVDIHISIDVEFLKVPDSEAKLYYKQPGKIHVESEKFALLPRQGLDFSPLSLLSGEYTAIFEGEDTIRRIPTSVVKIIPLGNDNDIILSTFWVDQFRNLIIRMEATKKPTGTFTIDFTYGKYGENFNLPSRMEFTFTVDRMIFPRGMDGQSDMDDESENESDNTTGKVYITYQNYKVNQNLPDELFEHENN